MNIRLLLLLVCICLPLFSAQAQQKLSVATLHPVLTDLAIRIGGDAVSVNGIAKPGTDIHSFSPSPDAVKQLEKCQLILASGVNLENYLAKLKESLQNGQILLAVGDKVPHITLNPNDAMFACCPAHAASAVDPHWWNSLENMKRAGQIVSDAFAKQQPAQADLFKQNAKVWRDELDALKRWAKKEISTIPSNKRVIASNHLSLSYFAQEHGFKLLPIMGLNTQTKPIASELATAVAKIKDLGVTTLFPEVGANTRHIEAVQKETGVKLGTALVMDMNAPGKLAGFQATYQHNVTALVAGLK
jgi:zinc/manganese transport system substrate-binding protein